MENLNIPSPVQKLQSDFLQEHDVEVWVKRDDLIHRSVSGNKWRKLKYHLEEAKSLGFDTILTFGGAFSNHLVASAVACSMHGLRSIGVIRGEKVTPLNSTLQKCIEAGMQLFFVTRDLYRLKEEKEFVEYLREQHGEFYLIPEGGSGELGVKGCGEIVDELKMDYDSICVAAGTGTTAAGILREVKNNQLIVVPVLKNGAFLREEILKYNTNEKSERLQLRTEYHFGGYAKINNELVDFTNSFFETYQIKLDLVYTAKLFFGIFDLIKRKTITPKTRLVLIHTGGLQGNIGLIEKHQLTLFKS